MGRRNTGGHTATRKRKSDDDMKGRTATKRAREEAQVTVDRSGVKSGLKTVQQALHSMPSQEPVIKHRFFKACDIPTEYELDKSHPLQDICGLLRQLDKYSRGQRILPPGLKEILVEHDYNDWVDVNFDYSAARENLGVIAEPEWVWDLVQANEEHFSDETSPTTYALTVQWPILNHAIKGSAYSSRTQLQHIADGRIKRTKLAPGLDDSSLQPKMGDYTFGVKRTMYTNMALGKVSNDFEHEHWNHINLKASKLHPIAISMVNTEFRSLKTAFDNIGVWLTAHFNRLTELMQASGSKRRLPVLPFVMIYEDAFIFCAATKGQNGVTIWRPKADTCSYSGYQEVHAHSMHGVYSILACLQLLLQWTAQEYADWFDENCLPLTKEQRREIRIELDRQHDLGMVW